MTRIQFIKFELTVLLLSSMMLALDCSAQNATRGTRDSLQGLLGIVSKELVKSGAKDAVDILNPRQNNLGLKLIIIGENDSVAKSLIEYPSDAFHIQVEHTRIQISGLTVSSLRNGIFWYLYFLGYRYYYPNPIWHYIPKLNTIYHPVKLIVQPSYQFRRIWYAYGAGSKRATSDYEFWFMANLQGGEEINAGHAYDGIVSRNRSEFLKHPEYFAQKVASGNIPNNPKFEVSNEGLVQLCIKDAFARIESYIRRYGRTPVSISMDPSDGGGFSTKPESLNIGGPSEQVFYLANRVAIAIKQKYPDVKVGLYAYNLHAAPPEFELDPNIVVLVATAMNQSKFRTDDLIKQWSKKNITLGIRDYFGVMAWDWDMPGMPNGSRLDYVEQLKKYHNAGIRIFSAETNIGWISRGLGHYLGARLLWDVKLNTEAIVEEYHKLMFGNGAPFMKQVFEQWQKYRQALPLEGDMYEWYKLVEKAAVAESDTLVQLRLNQVKQYLHYIVLFRKWRKDSSDENLIGLLNYAYRTQEDGIMASYPLFRRIANSAVKHKPKMLFSDKAAIWKQFNSPVTEKEINQNFIDDLQVFDREQKVVKYSYPQTFGNQVKASKSAKDISNEKANILSPRISLRGTHRLVIFVDSSRNAALHFSVGLVKSKNFKSLLVKVFPYSSDLKADAKSLLLEREIEPIGKMVKVSLESLLPGPYLVTLDDAKSGFLLSSSGGIRYGIIADSQRPVLTFSRNKLVFNVEDDIKQFNIVNKGVLTLISPTGRIIDLQKRTGRIQVDVKKDEYGVWTMDRQKGTVNLEGLLPLLSATQQTLIYP